MILKDKYVRIFSSKGGLLYERNKKRENKL